MKTLLATSLLVWFLSSHSRRIQSLFVWFSTANRKNFNKRSCFKNWKIPSLFYYNKYRGTNLIPRLIYCSQIPKTAITLTTNNSIYFLLLTHASHCSHVFSFEHFYFENISSKLEDIVNYLMCKWFNTNFIKYQVLLLPKHDQRYFSWEAS